MNTPCAKPEERGISYLNHDGRSFSVSKSSKGAGTFATLQPLSFKAKNGRALPVELETAERVDDLGEGLFRRKFRIANYSDETLELQAVSAAETTFVPTHWEIPCVMYGDNSYGEKNSPRGLEKDGEPWVFAYDRSSIPSCTLSESKDRVFASFASDESPASLKSSGSFERLADGRFRHKIVYPVVEAPTSYTDKNKMTARHETFLTLVPGGSFEAESFLFVSLPRWENYGYFNLLSRAFRVLKHDHLPAMQAETLKAVSLDYLRKSLAECDGRKCLGASYRDYTHPLGNQQKGGTWEGLSLKMIEENPSLNRLMREATGTTMGFSAQGFLLSRTLLADAIRRNDDELRNYVLGFLDDWISWQRPDGLISISYPRKETRLDLCNLGWGASESVKIFALLRKNGVRKDNYLSFAKRLCDFFVANYDEKDPFGRVWSIDGKKLEKGGCTGAFMMKAMLELHELCGEKAYLDCAKKAFDFYFRTELDFFRCTGGAIDCDSVDKESSFPFVYSALSLFKSSGERKYLDCAEKAATYFLSWMFCYDALYEPESDFAKLGYHTSGGTAISTEHHAIDPYAAIITPDLYELSALSGDRLWHDAGELIWINAGQCVAGPNGLKLHGLTRPPGSQNECFAQTRWTKYRSSPELRGHLNDFIGVWLPCFKLYAMEQAKDNGMELP